MNKRTRKSHVNPRLSLKKWGKGEQILTANLPEKKIFLQNIDNAATRRYYYDFSEIHLPENLEDVFGEEIETPAAPVIKQILETESLELLDDERYSLALFLSLQATRTPFTHSQFGKEIEKLDYETLKEILEDEKKFEQFLGSQREKGQEAVEFTREELLEKLESKEIQIRSKKDQQLQAMMAILFPMAEKYQKMSWTMIKAPDGEGFITSDNPLVRITIKRDDETHTEHVYPLSPKFALIMHESSDGSITQRRDATKEEVEEVNRRLVFHSSGLIFADDETLLEQMQETYNNNHHTIEKIKKGLPISAVSPIKLVN